MAMNSQLLAVVQHIENERGVSREIVLTAIEQAIAQAARKNANVTNDLRVVIDRKDLSLHVYDTLIASDEETGPGFIPLKRAERFNHGKPVAEGDVVDVEMPASRLGRIAAQTSRQMIMQKIREAERTNTFSEYKDRVGDIVSGTVSAISRRDTYVTVGKTEMILPGKERIPTEEYQVGDPIRAIIIRVDPEAKGPSVVLSRASGKFVEALFRLEVSEIADGVVEIMGVARDPGFRAKLAVPPHPRLALLAVRTHRRKVEARTRKAHAERLAERAFAVRRAAGQKDHHLASPFCGTYCAMPVSANETEPS